MDSMLPHVPDDCLVRLRAAMHARPRSIIGVAGAPGAGKSTLVQALAQALPRQVVVVPMDGFHLAQTELERLGRATRKGAPDTFDAWGYAALLARIRAPQGQTVYAPDFRRDLEEPVAGAIAVLPETPLVLTEGNYLLLDDAPWQAVRAQLDEVWYLDTPDTLRRSQLQARHMRHGRSAEQALAWMAQTDEPNAQRIAATRAQADWVLSWPRAA